MRDRIIELRRVAASSLLPHPRNWRKHPSPQADVLRGLLDEIGIANAVIARDTPDGLQLIDGHLRRDVVGDEEVPVLVVDLDEHEAEKLLATLDPLAGMVTADMTVLTELLGSVEFQTQAVNDMLGTLVAMPDPAEYPDLPTGEKGPIGQMTFTVTDEQREQIEGALARAKHSNMPLGTGNENSNGNALAHICRNYAVG